MTAARRALGDALQISLFKWAEVIHGQLDALPPADVRQTTMIKDLHSRVEKAVDDILEASQGEDQDRVMRRIELISLEITDLTRRV